MLEQLHRYTHEIINALSVRKVFSAVLVRRILNSWLSEAQQQKLTITQGSQECGARQRIVQFWEGWWSDDPSVLRQIRLRGY